MNPTTLASAIVLIAMVITGCTSTTQLSSGTTYLDRYNRAAGAPDQLNEEIREAANVEPILSFPARIGLARIERGRLTPIPQAEADAWLKMAGRLGAKFGEFLPISPLIAKLAASETAPRKFGYNYDQRVESIIRSIRLGAARQHVHAALIYEVSGRGSNESTVLSAADLTIIGMFLVPSRSLVAKGFASALLVDVRNGYPYGTARATANDSGISTLVGSDDRAKALAQEVRSQAAIALTDEVEKMARDLYVGILERKVSATRTE